MKHAAFFLVLSLVSTNTLADETSLRAFRFPEGIRISIPRDWKVYDEGKIRDYERGVANLVEKSPITPLVPLSETRVLFRAEKVGDGAVTRATMTVGPGELTQEEIQGWPPERIEMLGRMLADRRKRAVESIGARDVLISPPYRENLGGKTAVATSTTMSFKDKNTDIRIAAQTYFFYLERMTLICTFETIYSQPDAKGENINAIVTSLLIE